MIIFIFSNLVSKIINEIWYKNRNNYATVWLLTWILKRYCCSICCKNTTPFGWKWAEFALYKSYEKSLGTKYISFLYEVYLYKWYIVWGKRTIACTRLIYFCKKLYNCSMMVQNKCSKGTTYIANATGYQNIWPIYKHDNLPVEW